MAGAPVRPAIDRIVSSTRPWVSPRCLALSRPPSIDMEILSVVNFSLPIFPLSF